MVARHWSLLIAAIQTRNYKSHFPLSFPTEILSKYSGHCIGLGICAVYGDRAGSHSICRGRPILAVLRAMLSQCANPTCCRPLTSLSEGRLFQFEIVSISISASDESREDFDESP